MHESYENDIDAALSRLRAAHQFLLAEIKGYPGPISGCDAQFNRLLSDRTRVSNAIRALEQQPFVATPRALDPATASERP